jgi:hypothetical protein
MSATFELNCLHHSSSCELDLSEVSLCGLVAIDRTSPRDADVKSSKKESRRCTNKKESRRCTSARKSRHERGRRKKKKKKKQSDRTSKGHTSKRKNTAERSVTLPSAPLVSRSTGKSLGKPTSKQKQKQKQKRQSTPARRFTLKSPPEEVPQMDEEAAPSAPSIPCDCVDDFDTYYDAVGPDYQELEILTRVMPHPWMPTLLQALAQPGELATVYAREISAQFASKPSAQDYRPIIVRGFTRYLAQRSAEERAEGSAFVVADQYLPRNLFGETR